MGVIPFPRTIAERVGIVAIGVEPAAGAAGALARCGATVSHRQWEIEIAMEPRRTRLG